VSMALNDEAASTEAPSWADAVPAAQNAASEIAILRVLRFFMQFFPQDGGVLRTPTGVALAILRR
jgi:hypothetical protein